MRLPLRPIHLRAPVAMAQRRPLLWPSAIPASVALALLVAGEGEARADMPIGPSGPAPVGVGTAPPSPAPVGAQAAPASADERPAVRRGLIAVEQGGRVAGVGIVLGSDGRILTSLSALSGDDVTVKLPDGRSVKARVGHKDKASDLALLFLVTGKWTEGLRASEVDPSTVPLRGVVTTQSGKATTMPVTLRGRIDAKSKDGQDGVVGALDIELPKGAAPLAGGPLLDDQGNVLGLFVRACRPMSALAPRDGAPLGALFAVAPADAGGGAARNAKCAPTWVGAPVSWIRAFLSKTPREAVAPSPWLGIAGETGTSGSTAGVRVLAIAPQSPAEKAGLKSNSERAKAPLIVAVDGVPVATPEKLSELIASHGIGDTVKLLVLDAEKLKDVTVTLKAAP